MPKNARLTAFVLTRMEFQNLTPQANKGDLVFKARFVGKPLLAIDAGKPYVEHLFGQLAQR